MAGEYEHIKGKGNRFSSTNQPANRGRKPKLYTIAKKAYNISLDEYREVERYLIQCTKTELEEITKKDDTPIWVANIARALLKDTAKGVVIVLREIEERLFGKVPNASDTKDDIPDNIASGLNVEEWIKKEIEIKGGKKNDNEP